MVLKLVKDNMNKFFTIHYCCISKKDKDSVIGVNITPKEIGKEVDFNICIPGDYDHAYLYDAGKQIGTF